MELGTELSFERRGVTASPVQRPARTWAGRGTGAECSLCGASIASDEIEYEVEMPAGSPRRSSHFHFACYRSWAANGSKGVAPG
jgi:hypothetical protein